jgi:tRNA pseudouridine55 synthase
MRTYCFVFAGHWMSYFGFLNVNKPSGVTSRWVVDRVQRLVRPHKVGHAGTLDPLATGVLVVAIGQATRLIEYVQRLPKQYRGTFLLGRTSPTEDTDGEVTELVDPPIPSLAELQQAASGLIGVIEQTPPAYSAIKVEGRRSYDLARAGKEVALAPRPVTVHSLTILEYQYPQLLLDINCGGGTYVRTLGRELAERVGTGAVMSALERTAIGPFHVSQAIDPDALQTEMIAESLSSPQTALAALPTIIVDEQQQKRLANGLTIETAETATAEEIAAIDSTGRLVAILAPHANVLRPTRYFPV